MDYKLGNQTIQLNKFTIKEEDAEKQGETKESKDEIEKEKGMKESKKEIVKEEEIETEEV